MTKRTLSWHARGVRPRRTAEWVACAISIYTFTVLSVCIVYEVENYYNFHISSIRRGGQVEWPCTKVHRLYSRAHYHQLDPPTTWNRLSGRFWRPSVPNPIRKPKKSGTVVTRRVFHFCWHELFVKFIKDQQSLWTEDSFGTKMSGAKTLE